MNIILDLNNEHTPYRIAWLLKHGINDNKYPRIREICRTNNNMSVLFGTMRTEDLSINHLNLCRDFRIAYNRAKHNCRVNTDVQPEPDDDDDFINDGSDLDYYSDGDSEYEQNSESDETDDEMDCDEMVNVNGGVIINGDVGSVNINM